MKSIVVSAIEFIIAMAKFIGALRSGPFERARSRVTATGTIA